MSRKLFRGRTVLIVAAWFAAAAIVPIYTHFDHSGWDLQSYRKAASILRRGGNPYIEGPILYPPVTLSVLRVLQLPVFLYWLPYVSGVLATCYAGALLAEPAEREAALLAGPVAIYFPGMLKLDSVLGGNISYVAYGAVLMAAVRSWRTGRWRIFYATVLLASLIKPTWLTLLAIPFFSASRQRLRASVASAAGVLALLVQRWLYPHEFASWREALQMEFVYNGFGLSPAGVVAQWRFERGMSYAPAAAMAYLVTLALVLGCLWKASNLFRNGRISLERFAPVLLMGVLLLQPRVKDYDSAAVTILMGLVLWRISAGLRTALRVAIWCSVTAATNLIAANDWPSPTWNRCACSLLVGCFVAALFDCWRRSQPPSTFPTSSQASYSSPPEPTDSTFPVSSREYSS